MPPALTVRGVGGAAFLLLVSLFALQAPAPGQTPALETAFVCPMHPDYTLDVEGRCPRCGMALVRATPYDVRDYGFELTTSPAPVRAGQPAQWRFKVFHPDTHRQVTRFERVHEKEYHLFVISQDMEHFEHVHPDEQSDGTWTIGVTLPKPGYYALLSDFLPAGGSSQLIVRPLVTAGYTGDLVSDRAQLVPDASPMKTVGDITSTVTYDPPTFVAGLYGHLIFNLTDTQTGRAITDLQTYLGAFGHTLIMSEDMVDYVHTHSLDILATNDDDDGPQFLIAPGADLEALRGGPQVIFDGLMPKPGRYRAWTQFRRNGELHTFTSTFNVVAP
ncbi:MAG TPA: heavy metal-binding domain-containing protein [Vicinamibacterales bacterium]|nr:heavy metal-binding domain-containing protein [Vicinamibacterales bacterium]